MCGSLELRLARIGGICRGLRLAAAPDIQVGDNGATVWEAAPLVGPGYQRSVGVRITVSRGGGVSTVL